eukprot:CAMPEP_0194077848 /NCGR_PEP_ID=MMETSP0149-20130528/4408_1 /TAXON_ID=122233 /ORGANISM="Chaetoceros debilis, Strain MM31A-1" /LENGTH=234 /DNA_ID=CAMNT_0038758997 /DNA_START=108 /DNA_END=809 /DNA_ORIENTATION=+
MGSCCSCLKSGSDKAAETETELTDQKQSYTFKISRKMSAPTTKIQGGNGNSGDNDNLDLSGEGLALVDVSIEQDATYWEWHIECPDGTHHSSTTTTMEDDDYDDDDDFFAEGTSLKFGVTTKKNQNFYRALESNEDGDDGNLDDGTQLMRTIPNVQNGDTIGVAVQQSDLPMIQFLLNGEPLHELAISRFRGGVYPSVFVREGYNVKFVWEEDEFKELSPHVRFGPLIPERGLI